MSEAQVGTHISEAEVGKILQATASDLVAKWGDFPSEVVGPDGKNYTQIEVDSLTVEELAQYHSLIFIGQTISRPDEKNRLVAVQLAQVPLPGYLKVIPGTGYEYARSEAVGPWWSWSASYDIVADVPGVQHVYPGAVRIRGDQEPRTPGVEPGKITLGGNIVVDLLPISPSYFLQIEKYYSEGGAFHRRNVSPVDKPDLFPAARKLGEEGIRTDPADRAKIGAHALFDAGLQAMYGLRKD